MGITIEVLSVSIALSIIFSSSSHRIYTYMLYQGNSIVCRFQQAKITSTCVFLTTTQGQTTPIRDVKLSMEQFNPIFGESSLAFQIVSSVPKSTANCSLYNNPMQCLINTQDLEFCNIHLFVLHEFQKQRPQSSIIFDMNDLNARATEMYIYPILVLLSGASGRH